MATLQDLRNTFYDILRETQDDGGGTSAYPLTLVDLLLNAAQQKIIAGRVINPLTKEEVRKWDIYFLKKEKFYTTVPVVYVSEELSIWDTEIETSDTTWYPTSWTLFLEGNVIQYTNKTATQFTGVTGIEFAHKGWTQINYMYELPDDYSSIINVIYKNKLQLPAKQFDSIFEDLNAYKGSYKNRAQGINFYDAPHRIPPFYSIKDAKYILIYNFEEQDQMLKVRYERLPNNMEDANDIVDIDNDIYAKTTIPYLAVGEMLFNRWEEERAAQLLNFSMWQIREMYDRYNSTDYEQISGKAYRMGKWSRGWLNI